MAWRPIFTITVGVAGAGKTYSRVVYLVDKFLPHEAGRLYTNLPLKPAAIAAYCQKHYGSDPEEILKRIYPIPVDVLKEWQEEKGGPWDFFPHPVSGHIIIDEAHRFVSSQHSREWGKKWQQWIGELRHTHGTLELMTQAQNKLPSFFLSECERRIVVETDESRRDAWFRIEMHYWYQLLAKIRGRYAPLTVSTEFKNVGDKKYEATLNASYVRRPDVFELYESFSNPHLGGEALGRPTMEYERMGWPRFLLWFFLQNPQQILWRFGVVVFVAWLILGGWRMLFDRFMSTFTPEKKPAIAKVEKAKPAAVIGPPKKSEPQPTPSNGYDEYIDARRASAAMRNAQSVVKHSQAIPEQAKLPVIDELQAAIQQYEEAYKRSAEVVGMVGDEFILRDGSRFKKGETIPDGVLKGRSVVSFDRKTQLFTMDNGELLKLGGVPKSVQAGLAASSGSSRVSKPAGSVSGAVPGAAGGAAQGVQQVGGGPGGPGVPGPAVPVSPGVDRRPMGDQSDNGSGSAGKGSGAPSSPRNPSSNFGGSLTPVGR